MALFAATPMLPMYSDEENEWREVLCEPQSFPQKMKTIPEVDLIYAAQKAGMKIFV
jgi:hypothetical protein